MFNLMTTISSIDCRLNKLKYIDEKLSRLVIMQNIESFFNSVKTVETKMGKLNFKVNEVQDTYESLRVKLDELAVEKDSLWTVSSGGSGGSGKGKQMNKEIVNVKKQNDDLDSTITKLQCEAIKNNLVFYGIVDIPGEHIEHLLKGFILYEMNYTNEIEFLRVRFLKTKSKPRPIILI